LRLLSYVWLLSDLRLLRCRIRWLFLRWCRRRHFGAWWRRRYGTGVSVNYLHRHRRPGVPSHDENDRGCDRETHRKYEAQPLSERTSLGNLSGFGLIFFVPTPPGDRRYLIGSAIPRKNNRTVLNGCRAGDGNRASCRPAQRSTRFAHVARDLLSSRLQNGGTGEGSGPYYRDPI